MIDPLGSRIRDDIMASYDEPSRDLARRLLAVLPTQPHKRRSPLQPAALSAALLLVAAVVLIGRQMHLLPLSQDASRSGGLRPAVAPYSIVDNQFISATTGWILIQMHTTSGPLVLMKTTDGGTHWVEQYRYTGSGGIDSVQFSKNGREGAMSFLEGGATLVGPGQPIPPATPTVIKTYMTYDGGAHWRLVSTTAVNNPPKKAPRPAYSDSRPFFLDNNVEGWMVRTPTNQKLPIVVMHSADAGATWTQVGALPAGAGDGTVYFTSSKDGWYIIGDSRGFGFDAQGHPLPFSPVPALLYVTHDGGATWTPLTLPLPASAAASNVDTELGQPIMFNARQGVLPLKLVTGPTSPTDQGSPMAPSSYVLKTSDGGNHWTDPTQVSGTPGDGDILFMSLSHWLTASGALLSETMDGGQTWSTRRVLADGFTLSLANWDYISPKVIWAQIGSGSLIWSTDGGKTWTSVTPPVVH